MQKIPSTILLTIVLGLLVFSFQQIRIRDLQEELENSRSKILEMETKAQKQSLGLRLESAKSSELLEPGKTRSGPLSSRSMGNSSDHSQQAQIEKGMLASVNGIYGPFIRSLNLNPEEAEYFESLLAKRLFTRRELSQKWADAPEAQRREIEIQTHQLQTLNEAQIRKFLNYEDEYQAFLEYEPRIPEYQCLSGIQGALATYPLHPSQEARLIEVLYECRIAAEGQLQDGLSNWLAILEQPKSEELHDQWDTADRHLSGRLPEILSDQQKELFWKHWTTLRSHQKKEFPISSGN